MAVILVRYGETGLKSDPVRRRFENILAENIVRAHKLEGVSCIVEKQRGRLFVSSDDSDKSTSILSHTFGIVSVSLAEESSSDVEEIAKLSIASASKQMPKGGSFAVRARRTGSHPYTSMELAAKIGEKILHSFGGSNVKVNLNNPDFELNIEVRNNKAYIFDRVINGPGGLPLRSQGKVLSIIEDEKSLLATWLVMRRGCSAVILNKSNLPSSEIERLKAWNPWWSGAITDREPSDLIAMKRCSGLVLGWTLNEFEKKEKPGAGVPIFYPLLGMTSEEIKERMANIFA